MIKIKNVEKYFGVHKALAGVSLEVAPGEIHGLVGMNGSGKSTLLNILAGSSIISSTGSFEGGLILDGKPYKPYRPADAIAAGVGMIHQEFAIIPSMSAAENIMLTRENIIKGTGLLSKDLGLVSNRKNSMEAKNVLNRLGLQIPPESTVTTLPISIRQFIETAREIRRTDLKLLLLDEPTDSLHGEDVDKLMVVLRALAADGISIIYVSHRLDEILKLCDRITVLRDGEVSGRFEKRAFNIEALSKSMVGRHVVRAMKTHKSSTDSLAMKFENFSVKMPGEKLCGLNLEIKKGEILGIAGLTGQGRPALGYGVMGIHESTGTLMICGKPEKIRTEPDSMISSGVYLLPEDRRAMSLLMEHSVMENIVFTASQCRNLFLKTLLPAPLKFLDKKKARLYAKECAKKLNIKCSGISQKAGELSGGNQQKVCMARALAIEPEILFINEPTRGIDISAKELILNLLLDINDQKGTTLIISSSEHDELRRICDRIAVMFEGGISAILEPDAPEEAFALAMTGRTGALL